MNDSSDGDGGSNGITDTGQEGQSITVNGRGEQSMPDSRKAANT